MTSRPATAWTSTTTTVPTSRVQGRASPRRSGSASGRGSRRLRRARRASASRTTRSTSSRSRPAAGTSTTSRSATTSPIRRLRATTTRRGWGTPEISQIMQDLTGRLTPTHNTTPAPIVTSPSTTCGSLFTDPAGDDNYSFGPGARAPGASPQLDILERPRLPLGRRADAADDHHRQQPLERRSRPAVARTTTSWSSTYQRDAVLHPARRRASRAPCTPTTASSCTSSLENRYLQQHLDTGIDHSGPERDRRGRRAARGLHRA